MKKIDFDKMTEKQLQDKLIRFLKKYSLFYIKLQQGLRYLPQKNGQLKAYMGASYWPDLLIMLPFGKTILIELKKESGKLSDNQLNFFRKLKEYGTGVLLLKPSQYDSFIKNFITYFTQRDCCYFREGHNEVWYNVLWNNYGFSKIKEYKNETD